MAISWGPQVLTDITTGTIEGSVTVNWLCFPSAEIGSGLVEADLWVGPCHGQITLGIMETLGKAPNRTFRYHFGTKAHVYSPPVGPSDTDTFTVDVAEGAGPTTVSKTFTWSITGACLQERHGSEAISSEHGVVAAKECYGEDRWVLLAGATCTVTCGAATQTFDLLYDAAFSYALQASIGFDPDFWETAGVSPQASFSDLTVGGEVVDLTNDYPEERWYDGTGSNDLYAEGTNGGVAFWIDPDGVGYGNIPDGVTWAADILAPYIDNFALDVVDMAGVAVPDLVVWCSGVRDNDGNPVAHTVAEWNALSFVQSRGLVNRAGTVANAAGDMKFWADRDSMIALGLEVGDEGAAQQADTSTRSFSHDGRLCIDGWFPSATTRTETPYRTDIASIVHRDNVSIYGPGPACAHTDWVGDGVTTPDAGGSFEVTEVGGTLTLAIPSNYIARQGKVGGVGQIAVPTAYLCRQADSQYGNGSPAEDYEAVYDWRGWGYLRQDMIVPEACNVTAAIEYRDAEVINDNHLSDSTRQTDYEYSAGDPVTFTTYTPVAALEAAQMLCFDLCNPGHCFALVSVLTLTFDTVGAYQFTNAPLLVLDPGDDQSDPPRAAVTPHSAVKHFENYAYREGGLSAIVDGVHERALWWPDNYGGVANLLETLTGGMHDVLFGAGTGLDLTQCRSLAGYLSLPQLSGDAWETDYSSSAAADGLTRGGKTLTTLAAWDLAPILPEDGDTDTEAGLNTAVRVGQWTMVRGLQYTWSARHVVKGRLHGWVLDEGGNRARNVSPAGELYRRHYGSGGAYAEDVEAVVSDGHGCFATSGLQIVDTDQALFDYAVQWTGSEDFVSAGRLRTREWAALLGIITGGGRDPDIAQDEQGRALIAYISPDSTKVICRWWESPDSALSSEVIIYTGTELRHPSLALWPDGAAGCWFMEDERQRAAVSLKGAKSNWQLRGAGMLGDDLQYAAVDQFRGITFAAGLKDGACVVEWSNDCGASKSPIPGGGTTSEVCASMAEQQPALTFTPTGQVLVLVPGTDDVVRGYVSDGGGIANWRAAGSFTA